MDEIGKSYLTLALHLDRHFEGFVDAYVGPAELKAAVLAGEPRPLEALAGDARQLLEAIQSGVELARRRDYMARQAEAMEAVIQTLAGDRLDFVTEVERFFDITPAMVDEAAFEAAHAAMDKLLPGTGSLLERLTAWKAGFEIPPERILPVMDLARQETRRRTLALFDLPPGEELSLHLVKDQPWSAYNWYLGDYRSRIEINTDLPVRANAAVPLMAHEAYPGHHTEHAVKEQRLYRGQGRAEHAVQLLIAPECVLSEGIGDSAQGMLFDDDELAAFLHDELYPAAGLAGVDVDLQIQMEHAAEGLRGVSGNAALLLYSQGAPAGEVKKYLERYGLRTPQEAEHSLRFLQTPLYRSYTFNYAMGKSLLAPLLRGPDRVANFWRLLSEPLTPTQVRAWLAGREA